MINKPLLTSTKRCPHMAVQRKMLRNSRICPGFSTCWMTGTGRWPVAMTMGWSKWLSPSKCILWLVVSTYPSEKWWSQLGWWHSQLNEWKVIKWLFQTTNQISSGLTVCYGKAPDWSSLNQGPFFQRAMASIAILPGGIWDLWIFIPLNM